MDYNLLVEQVRTLVDGVASFILQEEGHVAERDIEIKDRNSLVSYVDKEAEKMLVSGLRDIFPSAGFITEEGTTEQIESEFTWIIDPLDGTTNFLQQIPFYSISVALVNGDDVILGVVRDVVHAESYYAWKGGGAWLNGDRIDIATRKEMAEAVVATGFPYNAVHLVPQLTTVFDYFIHHARGMRRLGSAALDLAYTACGVLDIYYETALNAWDIAAGILIVEEAGGVVTDFNGKRRMLKNGQVIAANPILHQRALTEIERIYRD